MEWCWDGEKCLKFHQWNDVAIAHFASENLRSLRKSKNVPCMPCAKVWKLAFRNLLKIVWPSASLLSSPRKRMQSWMRMQGMSCEKWSVPCTIQRTSETCCNSLQLRFPLCPQWNHVRTKNEILSTRSTVASITALAYSFAWCPALTALYGFMLWTKWPRNIHTLKTRHVATTLHIRR